MEINWPLFIDVILKIGSLGGLASIIWNIFLYKQSKKYNKWEAEMLLKQQQIEWEKMQRQHRSEYEDIEVLHGKFSGEMRNLNNKHAWEERAFFNKSEYLSNLAGHKPTIFLKTSFLKSIWRRIFR